MLHRLSNQQRLTFKLGSRKALRNLMRIYLFFYFYNSLPSAFILPFSLPRSLVYVSKRSIKLHFYPEDGKLRT
jgi:hypothetical protein